MEGVRSWCLRASAHCTASEGTDLPVDSEYFIGYADGIGTPSTD